VSSHRAPLHKLAKDGAHSTESENGRWDGAHVGLLCFGLAQHWGINWAALLVHRAQRNVAYRSITVTKGGGARRVNLRQLISTGYLCLLKDYAELVSVREHRWCINGENCQPDPGNMTQLQCLRFYAILFGASSSHRVSSQVYPLIN
jgi:hypothetical protein